MAVAIMPGIRGAAAVARRTRENVEGERVAAAVGTGRSTRQHSAVARFEAILHMDFVLYAPDVFSIALFRVGT